MEQKDHRVEMWDNDGRPLGEPRMVTAEEARKLEDLGDPDNSNIGHINVIPPR